MAKSTTVSPVTIIDELIAELSAAHEILAPQIRGITKINNDPLSNELHMELSNELGNRQQRDNLLLAAIAALEALLADGYPDLPPEPLSAAQFSELNSDVSDIQAGAAVFVRAPAASIEVTLEPFENKE